MEQFKLLLIEDSSNSCYLMLSQQREDLALTVANNENEALIALLYTRFNLILIDAMLINDDMIRFVKGAGGINCKTPVIVMVEPCDSHLTTRFEAWEVDACWSKPIKVAAFDPFIKREKIATGLAPRDYIQILLDKTQNNKNLVLTIFKKLFTELPQQIIDIKNALQNQQYKAALEIAHKLHGSVGFCGFTDIQQHAQALENSLLRQDYLAISGSYSALKAAVLAFTAKEAAILDVIIHG
jgi:HPt (histidine-containing phosphotransfer) domain-containing protein